MRTGRPCKALEPETRFHRLVTKATRVEGGAIVWDCDCDCGNTVTVLATDLRSKRGRKSCGCAKTDGSSRRVHGHKSSVAASRVYTCWVGMKRRCTDDTLPGWENYGGRGITVCDRWRDSFENFLADMGEPKSGESIDRIDNDGNYEPGNCRWATRLTQRRNSRAVVRVLSVFGERLVVKDAVEKYGVVGYQTVVGRLHRGWSEEEALVTPKTSRWKSTRGKR